ncbi:anti-sigma factor family protein [Streptomyces sp. NPDC012616]|uniref:anti-sigma factor family protein n=1 Tax=Streptomyces sp. NPDC012616 TaxID=3364840 RepID=UPI0036E27F60
MTSTTDTTGHPDVAEISDLTEGLLDPARSAAVRRHLDTCMLCADVHASLEEIQDLLGSQPEPPRMPDDVTRRIDAALAAEALLSAAASSGGDTHETSIPVGTDAEAAGVSRETAAASGRPSGHARSATTGPGRKDHKGGRDRTRLGRRRVAVLGAVFTAAALGLGSVLVSSLVGGGSPGTSAHQTAVPDTFSTSKLEGQVAALLTKAGGSRTPQSKGILGETGSETGNGSPRVLRQPTVPSCVQQGIGRRDSALATEEGTYQGKAALLVVLPDTSDSTRVDAYIVDSTCVNHPSTSPADVLLTTSYPRH